MTVTDELSYCIRIGDVLIGIRFYDLTDDKNGRVFKRAASSRKGFHFLKRLNFRCAEGYYMIRHKFFNPRRISIAAFFTEG